MNGKPNIVTLETQRLVSGEDRGNGFALVFENIGVDETGQRWLFYSDRGPLTFARTSGWERLPSPALPDQE